MRSLKAGYSQSRDLSYHTSIFVVVIPSDFMADDRPTADEVGPNEPLAFPRWEWMLPSDSMKIRRYNSISNLENILETDTFRFGASSEYKDDYEGRIVDSGNREPEELDIGDAELVQGNLDFAGGQQRYRERVQSRYYLSCWRVGTDESPQFWRRFTDSGDGIAVETTVRKLKEELRPEDDDDISMGLARYVSEGTEWIPELDPSAYFYKRPKFGLENELRVLIGRGSKPLMEVSDAGIVPDDWGEDRDEGIFIDVNLEEVVDRIIVAPDVSRAKFVEVRQMVSDRFEGNVPVVWSRLLWDQEPGPSHMLFGNDVYRITPDSIKEELDKEVARTSIPVWDAVDVVQVAPPTIPFDDHLVFGHFEIHRYQDDVPELTIYGQDHIDYQTSVCRYDETGLINELDFDQTD